MNNGRGSIAILLRSRNSGIRAKVANADKLPKGASEYDITNILSLTLEELNLSVRATLCLSRAGNKTLADILKYKSWDEIYKIRNMGKKSCDEVAKKLKEFGILDSVWTSKP